MSTTATPLGASARLENTTACLPLVHGSVAWYLGKKADDFQTHQWTLYLRGPNNEDLSQCIQKVVFQLHASFQQPMREFTEPPFEVTEKGWGEFEAQIRIHWKDPSENPTTVAHGIKLYPPGTPANTLPTDTDTPVIAESYDEVVFTNPTEVFFRMLQAVRDAPTIEEEYSQHKHFGQFSDTEDVHALLEAQKFLRDQLRTARERLKAIKEGAIELEDEVVKEIEQQQQQQLVQQQQKQQRQQQQQQQQQQQKRASGASGAASKGDPSAKPVAAATGASNRTRPAVAKQKSTSGKKIKQAK